MSTVVTRTPAFPIMPLRGLVPCDVQWTATGSGDPAA